MPCIQWFNTLRVCAEDKNGVCHHVAPVRQYTVLLAKPHQCRSGMSTICTTYKPKVQSVYPVHEANSHQEAPQSVMTRSDRLSSQKPAW